ncbi:DUF1835 domain-containing protein [Winogradskyella sp. 3972H.M.0a.05]|uniref:DUF1835 domain-containing protein n=1 Tax=Winogradskyella sp. 3972H.M.0a.05 TaxID=2950277 RepID=UPI003397447A
MNTKKSLHITNGNSLTDYLTELDIQGDFITWQEMLCEGPTISNIDSEAFFDIRKSFFNTYYDIEIDRDEYDSELEKLNNIEDYSEIVLWFEYDLFCHINLIGVLSLLKSKRVELPLYLVCSGRIEGEKDLKGLAELTPEQLLEHYKQKALLSADDVDLAVTIWRIYCGKDHNLLRPYITKNSSFKYLSNCLKAHLKRFPDSASGLGSIEANILAILRDNEVKSRHHLLGYILNYQGYYGYGDLQLDRIINKVSIFFDENEGAITLNRKGHEALLSHYNVTSEVNNNLYYGGIQRLDYQFSKSENKLIKTVINAY